MTDAEGRYIVTNLAPGQYEVTGELDGFAPNRGEIAVGAGDIKPLDLSLAVANVAEAVTVTGRRHGASTRPRRRSASTCRPEEIESLPVNGRNFANLMTLATGATTDGNGGWASVRFNGKSNQQNYLNYDGVDGSYVWDASPGYLNATGSQFRLQTSMESIAEFRVNSGLAPAESGLGAGGNITVISKSGSNRFNGSLFNYFRNDALDSASKYDDKKQELEFNQFGGSLGGPIAAEQDVLLRQLRGPEADDRPDASPRPCRAPRRFAGSRPASRSAAAPGQSPARTQAVAPLLAGFPQGTVATANPLLALATLDTQAEQTEHSHLGAASIIASPTTSRSTRACSTATATSTRRIARSRRDACTPRSSRSTSCFNHQSLFGTSVINELRVGYNRPKYDAHRVRPAGLRPDAGVALGHGHLAVDRRPRHDRRRAQRPARPRHQQRLDQRPGRTTRARSALSDTVTISRGAHTFKFGGEYRNIESQFQFLGSNEITYAGINEFIDNRPTQVAVSLESPVFTPQQSYLIGFAQDTWRVGSRLTLELGLRYDFYSVVKEKDEQAKPFFIEENAFGTDPDNFYNAGQEQLLAAAVGGLPVQRQDGAARRLRALLRPRPVRGPHPADRELHRAAPRAVDRRPRRRRSPIRSIRRSTATCSRSAATRTSGPTSTTCSTARASRASCPARST